MTLKNLAFYGQPGAIHDSYTRSTTDAHNIDVNTHCYCMVSKSKFSQLCNNYQRIFDRIQCFFWLEYRYSLDFIISVDNMWA